MGLVNKKKAVNSETLDHIKNKSYGGVSRNNFLSKDDEELDYNQLNEDDDFSDEYDETYDDFKTSNGDAELSKILIETESFINNIRLTIENKEIIKKRIIRKDGSQGTTNIPTRIKNTEPLMNNKGVSQVVGRVRSLISHVTALGNIDNEAYKMFCGRFIKDLGRTLIIHADEYELEKQNIRDVRRLITDPTLLFLTRPMGDKERGYNFGNNIKEDKESKGSVTDFINWGRKNKNK